MGNRIRFFLFGLWACTVCLAGSNSAADDKPNVILVMADDLGIGDISPTNSNCKIATPHLQQLADEGLTFLDAHTTSSVCTPTRYGLLTGRYNWRSRLSRGVLSGRSEHLIPAERATLAHLLRDSDYHTAMIGIWHLGWDCTKMERPSTLRSQYSTVRISMASITTMVIVVLWTCHRMSGLIVGG